MNCSILVVFCQRTFLEKASRMSHSSRRCVSLCIDLWHGRNAGLVVDRGSSELRIHEANAPREDRFGIIDYNLICFYIEIVRCDRLGSDGDVAVVRWIMTVDVIVHTWENTRSILSKHNYFYVKGRNRYNLNSFKFQCKGDRFVYWRTNIWRINWIVFYNR